MSYENIRPLAVRLILVLCSLLVIAVPMQSVYADGISQEQLNVLKSGVYWYNLGDDVGSACAASGEASLVGSTNVEKIFSNLTSRGLNAYAVSGILGNWQAESHFDPSIEQVPGKSWTNLSNDRNYAVGLAQWDGGRRPTLINYLLQKGLTSTDLTIPSDKLLSAELDFFWQEINGSPYKDNTLPALQTATSAADAAYTFHKYYEISNDTPARIQGRLDNATQIYSQYGQSQAGTATASSSTSGCSSNLSPDCQSATGNAKILCAAKKYDTTSYSESVAGGHQGAVAWHASCPVIGPSCVLDCSGLVNIAVYDVFGADLRENTDSERLHIGTNWKVIQFSEVQPGDLIQPNDGHVEIIDHVEGSTIITFGAHTSKYPQEKQVSPSSYPIAPGNLYLRYIGPGAQQ